LHKLFHELEQALPFSRLVVVGGEAIWMGRRIVNELSEEHCTARCQLPAGPPEMHRCWLPLSRHGLLVLARSIDRLKG